jgi:hypothetical protein
MKFSHTTAFGDTYSYEADIKDTVAAVLDRCKKYFGKDAESVALFGGVRAGICLAAPI